MPHSEGFAALTEEVHRIVASPYPTQLKLLCNIVCIQCTSDDICSWVLSRPCQLQRLVGCILDALRHWSYVLDLVTRLSSNIAFRDAFLQAEPTLLRDIVVRATHADDAASSYASAAVALVSHPLPKGIAIPTEYQTLLVRLFDRAAREPSVATIRPIYQLLRGSSALLIGILSDDILLHFEDQLFTITRNLKGDDQSLSLYCLAIMKTLAQAPEECLSASIVSSYDTQELLATTELPSSKKWKPDAVQQYFADRKAQKTMQLVVLRVVWACTATTNDSLDDKIESLRLANEIIVALPVQERETWRKANALVPKKLEEKLASQTLDISLRFHALCFLLRLTEGGAVPTAVLDGLRVAVLDIQNAQRIFCDNTSGILHDLIRREVFDTNTTTAFVQNAIDFISSADADVIAERSSSLSSVLRHLLAAISWQDPVAEGTMLALDVLACGNKLQRLGSPVTQLSGSFPLDGMAVCAQTLQNRRSQLVHEICRVFLKATLISSQSAYSIPRETLTLLLDLHASSAHAIAQCEHTQDRPSTIRQCAFAETQATSAGPTSNWREDLHSELATRSTSHHERLERLFVKACSDLEERCNTVEQPLRQEKERLAELQARYDDLEASHAALETESVDRHVQFDALEAERDQTLEDLHSAHEENEALSSRIEELQCKMREAVEEADQRVKESQRALEKAELMHAAFVASKEEEFEGAQGIVRALERRLNARDGELVTVQGSLEHAAADLEATREALRQSEKTAAEQAEASKMLAQEKDVFVKGYEKLEARCAILTSQIEDMRNAYQADVRRAGEEAEQRLASQKTEYEIQLDAQVNEHNIALEEIKTKLAEAERLACQADEHHVTELQHCQAKLGESERKMGRLQRKYEQKVQQLASATAMQQNIAAAMGLKAIEPQATLLRRSFRTFKAQTPHPHQEEDESQDPTPPTPPSCDDAGNHRHMIPEASSTEIDVQEGSTPKRPRPKKAFKIPSPARPKDTRLSMMSHNTRARTSRALRTTRESLRGGTIEDRRPLLNVSANRRSPVMMKAGVKTPGKSNERDEMDDTTWDGSELFAGTQS